MKNKNLLIGAGVLVVGYLLWKKSQRTVIEYSENCNAQLKIRLMQQDAKPPNFKKDFLERCREAENSSSAKLDVNSIPDSFVIKYDDYATTYGRSSAPLGNTSIMIYSKISGKTDGSYGMGSPISITAKEFEDAYKNLKQSFNIQTIVKDPSKATVGRTMTEDELKKFKCQIKYATLPRQAVIMPREYWAKHKEEWMKENCK